MARRLRINYDPRQFAVLGVYWAGSQKASLLSCDNKIIVFDNAGTARDFAPLLGNSRLVTWSGIEQDSLYFTPLDMSGINRVDIIHPYTIHDLPPNHPVASEPKSMGWKHHMIWTEWWYREKDAKRNGGS